MQQQRLSNATLGSLPDDVQKFSYSRDALKVKAVHLGVGAFHRGHQAVFTDLANAHESAPWGVVGISLRSRTAETQLAPQDGLYCVGIRDRQNERFQLVGNIVQVITAPDAPAAAMAALTNPDVSVVTMTITEKGYGLDPATGKLVTDHGEISDDLANPTEPKSAIGYLCEALRLRKNAGNAPFTAMSCDNLPSNGSRLKSALLQYANSLDPDLADWIESEASFPESMVDRIVPATTNDDLVAAEARIGVRDEGYVKTEPFLQWVIEDDFVGTRPQWEKAGARIVPDVSPYENAKLRLLNGAHSAIAYLGYLSGYQFVHEVMGDEQLSDFVTALMNDEIAPTLAEPADMPLLPYATDLRGRFRNSSLNHRTWQIAMDGSQKLPQRLLNTIRDRIKQDLPFPRLATAVAAWIVYAAGSSPDGGHIDVRDPMSETFKSIAAKAAGDAEILLTGFLSLNDVFGTDLPQNSAFREAVWRSLRTILDSSVSAAIEDAAQKSF